MYFIVNGSILNTIIRFKICFLKIRLRGNVLGISGWNMKIDRGILQRNGIVLNFKPN